MPVDAASFFGQPFLSITCPATLVFLSDCQLKIVMQKFNDGELVLYCTVEHLRYLIALRNENLVFTVWFS